MNKALGLLHLPEGWGPHLPELHSWGGSEALRPTAVAFLPASPAEYVNLQEPSMDMKSVTDRAAQTLLWTELVRGGPLGEGQVG